ncbi:hypothetical protein ES703_41041 [subsurface metagenome]
MTNNSKRVVIIGLDGMPYRLMKDLAESGVMRHTKAIIDEGLFQSMQSSIPEISSVSWASIITGTAPGYHGIYGFTDVHPGTYRMCFPNYNDLKMPPFWQHDGIGRSVIINVPFTFPAYRLDGVLISGFVALDLERATYPLSLIPKLKEMDYQIDVDSSRGHQSMDLFLADLDKTLQARIAAYRYLWDKEDWQTFMLVFTGTDRLGHFLWDAYEDKAHKYHAAFLDHLRQIDEVIGEIRGRMGDDEPMILISDHGMELSEADVQVNFLLKEQGFLKFKNNPPRSLADIDPGTRAFALDPGRIYISEKGKYPEGRVNPEDRAILIDELKSCFESLSVDGHKAVECIYLKEEIYEGPHFDNAPDMVLMTRKGINFKAGLRATELYGKGVFTGKHTQPDAFFLTSYPSADILPDEICVSDIVSIMGKVREAQGKR